MARASGRTDHYPSADTRGRWAGGSGGAGTRLDWATQASWATWVGAGTALRSWAAQGWGGGERVGPRFVRKQLPCSRRRETALGCLEQTRGLRSGHREGGWPLPLSFLCRFLNSSLSFSFFLFLSLNSYLLRCNSHTTRTTLSKCTTQRFNTVRRLGKHHL